jgi:CNT family concentrative nucleoside transporter
MFEYFIENGRYLGLIGIVVVLAVAFLFSTHRCKISIRLVFSALALQFLLAFFILKTSIGLIIFGQLADIFKSIYQYADSGVCFVFGDLAKCDGPWGFVFAIKVLPIIIFFGALMALLFHLGIVQIIVKGLAFAIRPILGTSGAETLSVAANSMLGQTEAPLLIKNYLANMTISETLTMMVSGMAHLSGAILAAYGLMGVPVLHMLSASFMAIPGSILISKILIPETETPETMGGQTIAVPRHTKNILDAVSTGTSDGLRLAVNVGAMLIAFISLIALFDSLLAWSTGYFMTTPLTLNILFGKMFYWIVYLLGIPAHECQAAGALLGQKLAINEFVAYSALIKAQLCERSQAILTYALAGFANFSSIGIQIGGIGAICPEKRELLTNLGVRALLGGTLANLLNAAIASLFI